MTQFHDELKSKMDEYAKLVYGVTKNFPREKYFSRKDYEELMRLADDIGGMLWGIIKKLK